MQEPTLVGVAVFIGIVTLILLMERAVERERFRDHCRWLATGRYLRKTGWRPLDSIQARLYDAYRRLDSHG